jgi:hypothetical protein
VVKKRHSIKHLLIVNHKRKILFLSEAYEGSVHDKAIADAEQLTFPDKTELLLDLGFEGYQVQNQISILMPEKKPKKKELTIGQKQSNKKNAQKRVIVENVIRQVKVFKAVKDICRYYRTCQRNLMMTLACALHNFAINYI